MDPLQKEGDLLSANDSTLTRFFNKNTMRISNINRILLLLLILSFSVGILCDYISKSSISSHNQIQFFNKQLNNKEQLATRTLLDLKSRFSQGGIDSLANYPFVKNDISYYIYQNKVLTFWSDNNLDARYLSNKRQSDWNYILLPNTHCLYRVLQAGPTIYIAVIKIKNNYPFQNQNLKNTFAFGFDIDDQLDIVLERTTNSHAILSTKGKFLFSLKSTNNQFNNNLYARIGYIAYLIAFGLFFFLYATAPSLFKKEKFNLDLFLSFFCGTALFLALILYYNLPELFLLNNSWSTLQYSSPPFFNSLTHLSLITAFFLSSHYLFYFHVNHKSVQNLSTQISYQIVFLLNFTLLYYLLKGLVYHSSIQINILHFNAFTFIGIYIHFLLLLWAAGLAMFYFKIQNINNCIKKTKQTFYINITLGVFLFLISFILEQNNAIALSISYILFCTALLTIYLTSNKISVYKLSAWTTLIFTFIFIANTLNLQNDKKQEKYKILTQNIYANGGIENDKMANILFEELDRQIQKDTKIESLIQKKDSFTAANEYLNNLYLRGFWNKYDIRINVAQVNSEKYLEFTEQITKNGVRLNGTHFYSIESNKNNMTYLGAFSIPRKMGNLHFFMEFYPRSQFKSYSYPNLLMSDVPNIQKNLSIGIAKYDHGKLIFNSGDIEFPKTSNWIPQNKSKFFTTNYNHHDNYIYAPKANHKVVIIEIESNTITTYLFYCFYTFIEFLIINWLIILIYTYIFKKEKVKLGLVARFEYSFTILLIVSFLCIFYVSVNFIQKKYKEQQIADLENKKDYIQKSLQEKYYWNLDLNQVNKQSLNLDLQDLSYLYHTDIHIYDNNGLLVASSQPLLFSKSIISDRMSPIPFFTMKTNMNQYEQIGKLDYLTGYTNFYNGDYLQIGFIAIPQFYSQAEISTEIEDFLAIIIYIYIIIISLTVLLSLFIGKQLASPLKVLENKLKEMRVGRRNEKIEYKLNDEIGQLVLQYNLTVEELEKSAELLAQSEREMAWKTMAKQIAHEINNPLTPIKLTIQQLFRMRKANDERFDEYFEKSTTLLIEQIDNLSHIASTFSNFARMPETHFINFKISDKLNAVIQLFRNNHEQIQIEYHEKGGNYSVSADPEQMVQVFNNLILNAIQAIPLNKPGKIKINIQEINNEVVIEIIDNGKGIPKAVHDKLFAPNFTTKNGGMGLGLALTKNFIELAGGTIKFTSKINEETCFTIKIPSNKK